MGWVLPLSSNTQILLNDGDNILVANGISILVEHYYCISAGTGHTINVEGQLISGSDRAIVAGTANAAADNIITIEATARVSSIDAVGIEMYGSGNSIRNAGTISAATAAITIHSDNGGSTSIVNTGTITAGENAIDPNWVDTSGTITFNNSGLISGTDSVYRGSGQAGTDLITNSGVMKGEVRLGADSDLYDGRKGHISGTVYGDAGNDRIYGGTENNVLDGGAGSDRIYGALGADKLTGGTEADTFIFKTIAESTVAASGRDTINDFAHGVDRIDLRSIDASSNGRGDQAFHYIGSHDFHHKSGELHFVKTSDDTMIQGDVNGDGKADFAIRLVGHISLNGADFML